MMCHPDLMYSGPFTTMDFTFIVVFEFDMGLNMLILR